MNTFGIRKAIKNFISKPNRKAIWIFGMQKSGTTAIAALLAKKTGKSVTLDTKYLWEPYSSQILSKEISIEELVNKYSYPFSKQIIKEPSATFIIDVIKQYFFLEKYVFIVRNPYDNIRSILNRLNLPGDKLSIDLSQINPNWQYIFQNEYGKNYIGVLAKRWVEANSQMEIINSESCVLVKYEDFILDKETYIENLAKELGLPKNKSISEIVNINYQSKGNRNTNIMEFFGAKNLNIINNTCEKVMNKFNYTSFK